MGPGSESATSTLVTTHIDEQSRVSYGSALFFLTASRRDIKCRNYPRNQPKAFQGHLHLAATYMMAGNERKARESAAEVLRIDPNFSFERFAKTTPWKNQDDLTNGLIEPLRKAGLK